MQREQLARCRAAEAVLLLQVREFESCSHEYHHLLGSEVTGNFCRESMRFTRRNSPLSAVLLLHSRHRSVHVPTRTSLPSYIMLVCVFYCDSFEQDYWNHPICSCFNRYLQFRFELTGYYNTVDLETRCFRQQWLLGYLSCCIIFYNFSNELSLIWV